MKTKKTFDTPREALAYLVPKLLEILENIPVKVPAYIQRKEYQYIYHKYNPQAPNTPYQPPKRIFKGYHKVTERRARIMETQFKLRWKVRKKMKLVKGFKRAKQDSGFWAALTIPGIPSRRKIYTLFTTDKVKFKKVMRLWAVSEVIKVRALVGPSGALCWRLGNHLVLVKPPRIFLMDQNGYPHAESGPAIAWDGEEYYFNHGALLKIPFLQNPNKLDAPKVWEQVKVAARKYRYAQKNLEALGPQRALKLLEAKIANRFKNDKAEFRLLKAHLVSHKIKYTVAGLKIVEDTGIRVIGVSPKIKTAKEALKSIVENKFISVQNSEFDPWGRPIRRDIIWVARQRIK